MSDRFASCLKLILQFEGGFVDDPADRGGRTNKGITQKTYNAWLVSHGKPEADVLNIPDADVAAIYKNRYWDVCHCDDLAAPLDVAVFDAAVNSGPARSTKWLQTALQLTSDGQIGPKTLAAIAACDAIDTTKKVIKLRETFFNTIGVGTQKKFLKGWLYRLGKLRKFCGV